MAQSTSNTSSPWILNRVEQNALADTIRLLPSLTESSNWDQWNPIFLDIAVQLGVKAYVTGDLDVPSIKPDGTLAVPTARLSLDEPPAGPGWEAAFDEVIIDFKQPDDSDNDDDDAHSVHSRQSHSSRHTSSDILDQPTPTTSADITALRRNLNTLYTILVNSIGHNSPLYLRINTTNNAMTSRDVFKAYKALWEIFVPVMELFETWTQV